MTLSAILGDFKIGQCDFETSLEIAEANWITKQTQKWSGDSKFLFLNILEG